MRRIGDYLRHTCTEIVASVNDYTKGHRIVQILKNMQDNKLTSPIKESKESNNFDYSHVDETKSASRSGYLGPWRPEVGWGGVRLRKSRSHRTTFANKMAAERNATSRACQQWVEGLATQTGTTPTQTGLHVVSRSQNVCKSSRGRVLCMRRHMHCCYGTVSIFGHNVLWDTESSRPPNESAHVQ